MSSPTSGSTTERGVADRATDVAKAVSDKAGEAAKTVTEAASAATQDMTKRVASEARDAVEEAAGSRKKRAERYLNSIGSAMEAGSKRLDQDGLASTAEYTRKAAHLVNRVAGELDDVDVTSAARRVEDFMRARPVASFATALLLGFAAYQLIKSDTHPNGGPR